MQSLKQRVIAIVEHAEPNLPMIGMFGSFGYPLFYFVWKYLFPQPYESMTLRLAEAVISLPWLFYSYLPKKAKDLFPLYFLFTVPVLMPFFFDFMLLKNEWSVAWAMSSMACLFLIILIVNDWRFICAYTVIGFVMAYAAVYAIDGHVSYTYFQAEYIPTYLFAFVGGLIANHKRHAAQLTKISLMRSLSGSIAHEMRNPLSSITNAIGTVQSIIPDRPAKHGEYQKFDLSYSSLIGIHDIIDESLGTIKRGNKIIDSILATLQDGAIDIKNFKRLSANNSIHAAILSYGYNDSKESELIVENTATKFDIFGDTDLFIYVLFNLIKNALHYKNKPGFKIEITTETGNKANYVRVRDTGPGIPQGKREIIFDRFYTHGKSGGNGLGLAFCRRVIESFGGTITCDSMEGHWTEFIICLPPYISKATNDIKREILHNKRILLADDQASNRVLLIKFISEWNCPFDQAENGVQALDLLSNTRYDLVFMDFEMPLLNGDEAVSMMRQTLNIEPELAHHCAKMPVIGVTALPLAEALARAEACGMNEVLSKPLRRSDINKVMERYFFSELPTIVSDYEDALANSRILLVDDNELSRKFMSMILSHYGCLIGQADNGKKALEMLEEQDYDLILMDMEMPVLTGVETSRLIRKGDGFSRFRNHADIPIIALTGNTDQLSMSEVKDAGMNHFLSKPIFRDELVSTLAYWLMNVKPLRKAMNPQQEIDNKPTAKTLEAICNESVLDDSIIESLKTVGDSDMLASLLEVFVRESENIIEELGNAASAADLKRFENLSHTLKGSSATIGANRLFLLAGYLNDLSRNGEWPDNNDWKWVMQVTLNQTVEEMTPLMIA
jgi:two-component system CAI-1 autoinducer sensor kinase/phosphatase CqsS